MIKPVLEIGNGAFGVRDKSLLAHAEGDTVSDLIARPMRFERGTDVGTSRTGKDGYVDKGKENLLQYPSNFGEWSTPAVGTAKSGGHPGYDGTNNAWLIDKFAKEGEPGENSYIFAPNTITLTGKVWTYSVYAKAANPYSSLFLYTSVGNVKYDLQNGTIIATSALQGNAIIQDVGDGWYRCWFHDESDINEKPRIQVRNLEGTMRSKGAVYVQDAQFELGISPSPVFGNRSQVNLIRNSNSLERLPWSKSNALTLTPNQLGYDGSYDAYKVAETANASFSHLQADVHRETVVNRSSDTTHTFSVYAKAGTLNGIIIRIDNIDSAATDLINNTTAESHINLNTMVQKRSAFMTTKVTRAGGQWVRVAVTFKAQFDNVNIYPADGLNAAEGGTGADSDAGHIFIQHPQLEVGEVATDYSDNFSFAGPLSNMPRIDYEDTDPHLRLEPTRMNLVKHSEYFAHSSWNVASQTKNGGFVFVSGQESPSGQKGVFKFTATTGGFGSQIGHVSQENMRDGAAHTTGDVITNSIWIKRAAGSDTINLRFRNVNNQIGLETTLTDADGWKRISVSAKQILTDPPTEPSTSIPGLRHYINLQNSGDAVYVWGAQQEEGNAADDGNNYDSTTGGSDKHFTTSYIPTYGAAVTRLNEGTTLSAGDLMDLSEYFDGDDFTMYVELEENPLFIRDNSAGGIRLSNGDSQSGALRIYRNSNNPIRFRALISPTTGQDTGFDLGNVTKIAIKRVRSTGVFTFYGDGSPIVIANITDSNGRHTNANFDVSMDDLFLRGKGSIMKLKGFKLFNEALTDAQLATLTS
tara:strand:- start:4584 stop:7010 length:2427 start_codon:yes stop_codon:yes gene_type:complete